MAERQYYTYLMTNERNTVIYTGMTNNIRYRPRPHREGKSAFTKKYNVVKLAYFEEKDSPAEAIAREKQSKAGSREKKEALINSINPEWRDLWDDLTFY